MFNILKEGDSYTVTLHAVGMTISVDNRCLKLEAKFSCCEFFFMHVNKHAILLNTLLLCLDTAVLPGWMVILRGTWTNH